MATGARPQDFPIIVAFAISLLGISSLAWLVDPTPVLVEPRPDLDLPLALAGIAAGLWAARQIIRSPYIRPRRLQRKRWVLWIMLPVWIGVGLPTSFNRLQEVITFRDGAGQREHTTVLVIGKKMWSTYRRKRTFFDVSIANPFNESSFDIRVDAETFARIEPNRECVTLLVERAYNGAVRLVGPAKWRAPCPWMDR